MLQSCNLHHLLGVLLDTPFQLSPINSFFSLSLFWGPNWPSRYHDCWAPAFGFWLHLQSPQSSGTSYINFPMPTQRLWFSKQSVLALAHTVTSDVAFASAAGLITYYQTKRANWLALKLILLTPPSFSNHYAHDMRRKISLEKETHLLLHQGQIRLPWSHWSSWLVANLCS